MKTDAVVLEIDRIVAGGYGLARTARGTVLVRGALPGERVTGRPVLSSGVLRAHAIEILSPHPARVHDALPPGADLPLAYEEQLPIKEGLVREALGRIAKVEHALEPIAASPRALAYRTAAQYVCVDGGGLGARAQDSNAIVPLSEDPLASEPVAEAFRACIQRSLHGIEEVVFRASMHEGRVLVGLIGRKVAIAERLARTLEAIGVAGVVWGEPDKRGRFRGGSQVLSGEDRLVEDFGGVLATITVQSFSQVNPGASGLLYREAVTIAGEGKRAVELYAGSGVLGLHLAPTFGEILAVEITADAVKRGEADARRLGAQGVTFHRGDAKGARRFFPADVAVVNPPRAGLDQEVIKLLADSAQPRIVYVSCNPSTWARDVGRLVELGYKLTFARPYDFYPFTHHVEVLSLLER